MNVIPTCDCMGFSSICISSRSLRSSAPSGSSSSRTLGRFTSARAQRDALLLTARQLRGLRARELAHLRTISSASPTRLADLGLAHLLLTQAVRDVLRRRSCAGRARSPGTPCSRRACTGARPGPSWPWRCGSRLRPDASNPASMRSVVVLPHPDGPSSDRNSPGRTWMLSDVDGRNRPEPLQSRRSTRRNRSSRLNGAGHSPLLDVRSAGVWSRRLCGARRIASDRVTVLATKGSSGG